MKEAIEQSIIDFNKMHYSKANDTKMCEDKVYKQLQEDTKRDKIIDSTLERNECNNNETYEFLKLLANLNTNKKIVFSNQLIMKIRKRW